jgi:hypothetical protein
MPRKDEYKRVRDGLIYADVGAMHMKMAQSMVTEDHSDKTKFLRWLIEQEWERRGKPKLEGAEPVPIFEGRR